jgi:hypothetical protein
MNHQKWTVSDLSAASGRSAFICLLLFFVLTGWSYGAASPFELDVGELDKSSSPSGAAGEKPSRPVKKPAVRGKVRPKRISEAERKGEYFEYTIRSGDHLHGVLISRFGLSATRAEELTPVIMRINGISNPSGLRIGQTILIPASVRKSAAPAQPGDAKPAPTAQPAATIPVPQAPQTVTPSDSPQAAVRPFDGYEDVLARMRKFLAILFPGRVPPADAVREKVVGSIRYPAVSGRDGRVFIFAPAGNPPVFANMSGAHADDKTVVVDPADGKKSLSALLDAAGFDRVAEQAQFQFGDDPKLRMTADFVVTKKSDGRDGSETMLVMEGHGGCIPYPEVLAVFLSGKGYGFAEWCEDPLVKEVSPEIRVYPVQSGQTAAIIDTVLDALSLRWSRDYPVDVMVGRKDAPPLRVTVNRYFEEKGEKYIVDFENGDPGHATFVRMLELAGYRKIAVNARDDLQSIAQKLLMPLNLMAEYRKHIFTFHDRYSVEVSGVLIPVVDAGGRIPFVTDLKLDPLITDLINRGQWEMR